MKMRYLATDFAIGLSGPAFADTATIEQYGPGNTAQIDQLSNASASAWIRQDSTGHSEGNDSKVRQENNAGTVDAHNPLFDVLFEKAIAETNDSLRYQLYRQADQLMINDAPVVPLWYDKAVRLVQPNIKGFNANALNLLELKKTFKN